MQRVITERGGAARIRALTGSMGMHRPLLVCSRRVAAELAWPGAAVFSGFEPNPQWEDCLRAASAFRAGGCDGLAAMGGGSCMDTAKAVKAILMADSPEDALRSRLTAEAGPPLLCAPTTAGTGSESTPFAVVYTGLNKVSVAHEALLPDTVLLDSEMLRSLPGLHRKSCALDAFCQGVESFWAGCATGESRAHAKAAFTGVLRHLPAYLAGDADAAEQMLIAACESGQAIAVTRTTAAHAMSYRITKRLGCPHGQACALTLPGLWERLNGETACRETMTALAEALGVSPEDAPRLARGLLWAMNLPTPWNPGEDALNELTDSVNAQRLNNHPMKLSREDILAVYRESLTPPDPAEKAACAALWEARHG
ncbi:MAG: phosphonoacetaldehyde reductase [Clostridia bacterium]|nr:phosphonoacetaldehyde reductase [Clostridia bacterium]